MSESVFYVTDQTSTDNLSPFSATVFFGLYFSMRNKDSITSQMSWATFSAAAAVLAELPFDKAKFHMMGSRRTLMFANGLFIPFGGLLLVMYDKSLSKLYERNAEE